MTGLLRTITASVAAAAALLTAAAAADAARFDVIACRSGADATTITPDLQATWNPTDPLFPLIFSASNTCQSAGSMTQTLTMTDEFAGPNWYIRHRIYPVGMLVGIRGHHSLQGGTNPQGTPEQPAAARGDIVVQTGFSSSLIADRLAIPEATADSTIERSFHWQSPTPAGVNASSVSAEAGCRVNTWSGHCNTVRAEHRTDDLVLEMDDSIPPQGLARNSVGYDPVLWGTETVNVEGYDNVGFRRATLEVDGVLLDEWDAGAACAPLPGYATPTYARTRPCATTAAFQLAVNTTSLEDGDHRFVIRGYDALGNTAVILDRTAPVRNSAPPTALGAPTIVGAAVVGQSLRVTPPAFDDHGVSPMTIAHQWLRCDAAGANCSPVAAATGDARIVNPADVGGTLRVRTTATTPSGTTSVQSAPTAVVAAPGTEGAGQSAGGTPGAIIIEQIIVPASPLPPVIRAVPVTGAARLTLKLLSPKRAQIRAGTRVYVGGASRNDNGTLPSKITVTVQGRARGTRRWRTVASVRTNSRGVYTASLVAPARALEMRARASLPTGRLTSSRIALPVRRVRG